MLNSPHLPFPKSMISKGFLCRTIGPSVHFTFACSQSNNSQIVYRLSKKRERVFQGLKLSQEDEGQASLSSVPVVPKGSSCCTRKIEAKEKEEYVFSGPSGTNGPAKSSDIDVDSFFSRGQFPVCSCCGRPISVLSELTNLDGKPVHRRCKLRLMLRRKNLQKKRRAKKTKQKMTGRRKKMLQNSFFRLHTLRR